MQQQDELEEKLLSEERQLRKEKKAKKKQKKKSRQEGGDESDPEVKHRKKKKKEKRYSVNEGEEPPSREKKKKKKKHRREEEDEFQVEEREDAKQREEEEEGGQEIFTNKATVVVDSKREQEKLKPSQSLQEGGLASAAVLDKKKERKEKDREDEYFKRLHYDSYLYGNLVPQQSGVKKRLVKRMQTLRPKCWERRWVLHPDCSTTAEHLREVWIRKWVQFDTVDQIAEMNCDGLSREEVQTLKMLQWDDCISYEEGFYNFDEFLDNIEVTFMCELDNCSKCYFDLSNYSGIQLCELGALRKHMVEKHGLSEGSVRIDGDRILVSNETNPLGGVPVISVS